MVPRKFLERVLELIFESNEAHKFWFISLKGREDEY